MIDTDVTANRQSFFRDRLILGAAIVAAPVLLLLANRIGLLQPRISVPTLTFFLWVGAALPVIEELAFRGGLQGILVSRSWGSRRLLGLTAGNILTSGAFALAHVPAHPVGWAVATFAPSLVFGHFRDRYAGVALPILFHCYYNLTYFLFFA